MLPNEATTTEHAERVDGTDDPERVAVVNGLVELAWFLTANPDVPKLASSTIIHSVLADNDAAGRAEVERAAAAMGVDVNVSTHGHIGADRTFGPVTYRVVYVPKEEMRRYTARVSRDAE